MRLLVDMDGVITDFNKTIWDIFEREYPDMLKDFPRPKELTEFYAEDKWWPVDISEADKYTALATYYFGHNPANRIEFSRGRDIKPEPLPNSGPINFLAYPVLEIDGEPVLAETEFSFVRTKKDS